MTEKMCRVLVDLSSFRPDRTGGAQRFVYELFSRLSQTPDLSLHFAVDPRALEWVSAFPGLHQDAVGAVEAPGSGVMNFALLKRAVRRMSFDLSADTVISPFNLPVLRTHGREVLTVHDLAPFFYLRSSRCRPPSAKGRLELGGRLRRTRGAIREGTPIVTDSAAIEAELWDFGAVNGRTIHLGGDSAAVVASSRRWRVENLEQRSVLVISSTRPHKNLDLLRAVASSGAGALANVRFVLVGLEGDHSSLPFPANVGVLGRVTDCELVELLASASCLFSPSMYEGFGLPVAEAMHLGVPVVISDLPVHRELAGGAGIFFSPASTEDAVSALAAALSGGQATLERSRQLLARAERFRWDRCSSEYASLMRS
jgi:glycosyltransferase involved in cell wall biosynthesis